MAASELALILSACRTPIASFGGALREVPAADLGAVVVREAIARAGVSHTDVGDVILGCVLQAGAGMNVARQAAIKAGVPVDVPAETVSDGCVTAGNASGINDGAAALVVASSERAKALGRVPMARILGYATIGVDPMVMGMGPVPAVRRALERAQLTLADIDLFELNEAFAAQSIAVVLELGIDGRKVNVHGGAIALGHPIGASGARVLTTLIYALQKRGGGKGVAALCIGGGMGIAMVIEVSSASRVER